MGENVVLTRLMEERDEVRAAAVALAESDSFNPEDETYSELKKRAAELDRRIGELAALNEARAAADSLDAKLARSARGREQRSNGREPAARESWGAAFVRSDVFTGYGRHGQSAKLDVEMRELPTGLSDLAGAGWNGATSQIDASGPVTPTPLLDASTSVQVSGNAVEFVAWNKVAGGAAVVPEKGEKPSVEFAPAVTSSTLEMVAAYTQLTRQLIEDAAAVRSLIDGELRREVIRKEEAQAAAAIAAAALPTATGADLLAAIRNGMATVQGAGYAPNAVLLNPADYADLDVSLIGATNGPIVNRTFWGLTPIASAEQPAGSAVVGDFKTAVQHFYRSEVQLFITDSHANTFLSNVFTLLAERRSLTAVVRPDALAAAAAGAGE